MDRYLQSEINGAPAAGALLLSTFARQTWADQISDLDISVWSEVSRRKVADNLHSISISCLIQDYY